MMVLAVVACGNNGGTPDTADTPDAADTADTADPEEDVADADTDEDADEAEAPPVAAGEEISLTFMHFWDRDGEHHNPEPSAFFVLVEEWREANPNIEIIESTMSHDDFLILAQTQAAANDLPDMFFMRAQWLDTWRDSGLLADLGADVLAMDRYDQWSPGILDEMRIGDSIYGLPINGQLCTSVVFYNVEFWRDAGFETFPNTWEEVRQAQGHFEEQGLYTFVLGNQDRWVLTNAWVPIIGYRFMGGDWVDGIVNLDGSANFTDPGFLELLEWVEELGQSGVLNPDFNSIANNIGYDLFGQGQSATVAAGSWAVSHFIDTADEEVLENIRLAVLPQVAGPLVGNARSTTSTTGWFVSVNNHLEGSRREAAIQFLLDIYASEEFSYMITTEGAPAPMITGDVDISGLHPLRQEFIEFMNDTTITHALVWDMVITPALMDEINIVSQEVSGGSMTPEEGVRRLQETLESLW